MSLPQQKFREIVFLVLYSKDFGCEDMDEFVLFLMPVLKTTKKGITLASERAASVEKHIPEIDELIAKQSLSYDFNRISRVERNVLRLGLFELIHDSSIPPKVAIHEAVRLCRKFGTRESAQYINAILDGIYKEKYPESANQVAEEPAAL